MRRTVQCLGLVLTLLMLSACAGPKPEPTRERIENVQRIFYHEGSRYTLMIVDPETKQATMRTFYGQVALFFDISNGEPMWALYEVTDFYQDIDKWIPIYRLKIHMTSPSAVEGGAWNHGKFGSGSTEVIR